MVRGLPFINPHFLWELIMQNLRQRSALSDKMQMINKIERAEQYRLQFYTSVGYVGLVFVQLSIIPNLFFGMAYYFFCGGHFLASVCLSVRSAKAVEYKRSGRKQG